MAVIGLSFASVLFAQKELPLLVVPKDDGLAIDGEIHHMWVGKANTVTLSYIGGFELLSIETDNGVIDTGYYYLAKHAVIPRTPGPVALKARARYYMGKWDTTSVSATFQAVVMPKIKVEVVGNPNRSDTAIFLKLVDERTGAQMSDRYQVGPAFDVSIYNTEDSLICELPYRLGTMIDLRPFIKHCKERDGWQRMNFRLMVRDMETGLLIPTDEVNYRF